MKEAIVGKGPTVNIQDVSIPKPNADQVLIKVVYSGSNPKDWKRPEWGPDPHNSGDDVAGYIEAAGENVTEFHKGDRVAAFHQMMTDHGSFAEYAIAWAYTTFHLPKKTSFEEGATIPLAAMTAAVGLYRTKNLGLPQPWDPATEKTPLVVYGGSSAVGAFAIKLAQLSNIHPIIAVAGRGEAFVEKLISREKGDTIIDYRKGDEAVVSGIKEAVKKAGASEVKYAYDAVSEKGSYQNISQVLAKEGSRMTLILPFKEYSEIPDHIYRSITMVGDAHAPPPKEQAAEGIQTGGKEFAFAYFRLFAKGLQDGWFSGHPYEVVPGGLGGVQKALADLKDGKNSATKYIMKIEDTKSNL